MQTLKEISSGIAGVVEQAGPSVVRIEAGRRFPGSGIVWAADGTIVTADHVIEQEDEIRVGLPMVSSWLPLWPVVIQEPIWPYCGRRPLVLACRPGAMARRRSASW